MERAAVVDGKYRYLLTRKWSGQPEVCWVMLNPSSADAMEDDPTIRRCISFAQRWGFGSLSVVNLYAFRATQPRDLHRLSLDPVGPLNEEFVGKTIRNATLVVVAWGAHGSSREDWYRQVADENGGIRSTCLGMNGDGSPKHPLYVPGDTHLGAWS